MKWFGVAVVLALFLTSARGDALDERYLQIYNTVKEGDTLAAGLQPRSALDKYLEAQKRLQLLQRTNPDWNANLVNFRLAYLAERIASLSANLPAAKAPEAGNAPSKIGSSSQPPAARAADLERIAALEETVRQLQTDKSLLENKLKEALAVMPSAIDPRELTKAEEKIRHLQKENDLLQATIEGKSRLQPNTAAPPVREETEELRALRAENGLIKKQLAEAQSAVTNVPAQTDLEQKLSEAAAQIAALQSDKDLLRLEKEALEKRLQTTADTLTEKSKSNQEQAQAALRARQLELERDELARKLEQAQKDLAAREDRSATRRVKKLESEVTGLRSTIATLEAKKVPFTAEELALFRKPEAAETAKRVRTPAKQEKSLTPAAANLAARAQDRTAARDYAAAQATYEEVVKENPASAEMLAGLAAVELERNELDQAGQHLETALRSAPNHPHSLGLLGALKYRQGKFDAALETLSQAAKLDPQNAEVQNYLGLTLSQKGMRVPAETALRKAIQLQPGYGSAHYNLAVIYATQQPPAPELARWHYQKALAAGQPANPDLEKRLQK